MDTITVTLSINNIDELSTLISKVQTDANTLQSDVDTLNADIDAIKSFKVSATVK